MRKFLLATTACIALPPGIAHAASRESASLAELQALQSQLQAMAQRLSRLETINTDLRAEQAELQARTQRRDAEAAELRTQTKELRAETAVTAAEVAKVQGADWATRIRARGDLRYRHEATRSERNVDGTAEDAADRDRDRIRARLGFDLAIADHLKGTLLLSTGADDPRGTNQTLGGNSTRKAIGLDLAYVDWRFAPGVDLVLGKQPYPVWRPMQSLFLDSDVNPEGGALRFSRGSVFANIYGFWINEQYNADPAGENSDANIVGLQAGTKFRLLGGETVLAASFYDCGACQDNSPLYNNNSNGNTTYSVGGVNVLTYGYNVLDLSAQVSSTWLERPLTFTAGYARNLASDVELDTAYAFGVYLGRAVNPRTWELGLLYQSIDKDALFGQIVDSDFGDGRTDSAGWMFKGGYAVATNVVLNASYFLNVTNKDTGTALDVRKLQLDVNYRF